jgi:hypothetical protein
MLLAHDDVRCNSLLVFGGVTADTGRQATIAELSRSAGTGPNNHTGGSTPRG